ncbi:YfiR family protein [Desulfobacter latus]|uniref:YfiR family protein n=1 Tax=Desulfobacter latus TaxID=2292 RepID=A0A850T6M3_9BACT|nr:YfiR family protein [Desulfobacter latus]NWH05022.1 YfiR family protein [Desulfobacter latus]
MQPLTYKIIKLFIQACICQILLCIIATGTVQSQNLEEYRVKAAFIYNFTKLIQWPQTAFDSDGEDFKLVVFGDEYLKESFQSIDGKISTGRRISIQYSYSDPKADNYKKTLAKSHIIFISRHIRLAQVLEVLSSIGNRPVLTIGEDKNFSRAGGIIQFFTKNDQLHFEVNMKEAEAHQLKFSSRLLKLAVIVNEKE